MTQLNCLVRNCTYNDMDCCCKGDIMVKGSNARKTEDTCCASFKEKSSNTCSNSTMHPSKNAEVDCEASECVHNSDCKCNAAEIGIAGSNACKCGETECTSFCYK